MRQALVVGLLVAMSAALYFHRLDWAPPHVEIDEVLIGLEGHAVATTGHDLRGERLPLYFPTGEHSWYQPIVIYLTAAVLEVLPLNEWSVRVPAVLIGLADVVLMFFVARQLLRSAAFGAVAAALLAVTPGHFIHARYGMDYLYPVPFILGWLLLLATYLERPRTWLLVGAMAVLGVGFYSYIASIVLMPVYFAMTLLVLVRGGAPRRALLIAAAAFLPWLVPFAAWALRHPHAFDATVTKYALYDPNQLNALQGLRSLISYASLSERLSRYWNFYNPAFLFFGSGIKMMFSTNLAGVFLFPIALLLPLGIVDTWRRRAPLDLAILLGFVTAPVPAALAGEENAIFRALALLPFTILLAAYGIRYLWHAPVPALVRRAYVPVGAAAFAVGALYAVWTMAANAHVAASAVPLAAAGVAVLASGATLQRTQRWNVVAVGLLAVAALQFTSFWRDYFSDYRRRVSYWLGGNIGGALEEVIARDGREHVAAVYFSALKSGSGSIEGRNEYMPAYWQFYTTKHHREDLLARTAPFDPARVAAVPRGSLVVANHDDRGIQALVARGDLKPVASIPELNGPDFFMVLER